MAFSVYGMHINRIIYGHAQSAPLPDGVMLDSPVAAENTAVKIYDVAFDTRTVGKNHVKIFPAREILTFLAARRVQTGFAGKTEHLGLFHGSEGEAHLFKNPARHAVQKIRLILAGIGGAGDHAGPLFRAENARFRPHDFRIMAGAEIIVPNPQPFCAFQHRAEFDILIAHDARIRRPAGAVFGLKIVENFPLIRLPHVNHMILNAPLRAEPPAFLDILLFAGAVAGLPDGLFGMRRTEIGKTSVPQRHGDTDDAAAFLFEQKSRQSGIHPAAHSDQNGVAAFRQPLFNVCHVFQSTPNQLRAKNAAACSRRGRARS